MPIDFYQLPGSAPCRAVALTAAVLGVELNAKELDLQKGEHLKPEFLKINPQHTIPTIDDNGLHLWESRAIMTYLAEQYGKNDSLYPKDPKARAVINQRLYFDACTLYKAFADYYYPVLFQKAPKDPKKMESIDTAFSLLDKFLEGQDFVAGKTVTLADLTIVVTVATCEVVKYDFSKFKNVTRWYAKVKSTIPKYQEITENGIKVFKSFVEQLSK